MAHELEQHGNETAFVSAREDAWHQLGTVLTDTFTAEVAMQEAHLAGWDVRKAPLYATDVLQDEGIPVAQRFATIRTNPWTGKPEVLGVVGSKYQPIQNEDHAELLNALVDESGAHFETAGSIKGGTQTFLTMKLPETMTIGGVDKVTPYIAALNSHDGTMAFQFLVTPIRIVCANTQAAALNSAKSRFSVRHTKNGTKAIFQQARETLGMTYKYLEVFEKEAERMIQETMTLTQFEAIVSDLFPIADTDSELVAGRKTVEQRTLIRLFEDSETMKDIRGTRWSGYQAVTEYLDHFRTIGGKDESKSQITRALQTATGANEDLKHRAFRLMMA
jgi:phage/plasmid-like protein (TIGR03299 family)